MAHKRKRAILDIFRKSLRSWPVVSFFGPRQCGKSTFLRELAFKEGESRYETLDLISTRDRASRHPSVFLERDKDQVLILDEVQKTPFLFDEIKAIVDLRRKPSQFVLSGSVLFSKKIGVRESLTGRTATLKMDAMSFLETLEKEKPSLKSYLKCMQLGGMPGVCFLRDEAVRKDYWEQWLETLCERDLKILGGGRLSGDLARRIIENLATLKMPSATELAKKLRVDTRRVNTHLDALKELFIIREVFPHEKGVGKSLYFIFDCGLATHFKADERRLWQISFLLETQHRYMLKQKGYASIRYYLTRRGSYIDFELENQFSFFCPDSSPSKREMMTIKAAQKENPKAEFFIYCPTEQSHKLDASVFSVPWYQMALP